MTEQPHPVDLGDLIEYLAGELSPAAADALEEHLFECPRCAAELEALGTLRNAVRDAVRRAAVGANVTDAFLERAIADGLTLREYRLEPGQCVPCSAGPEDLFVIRLAADLPGAEHLRLEVDLEDLERGMSQALPERAVVADLTLGEVLLVFPGDLVRAYPRSRWSLVIKGQAASGQQPKLGPFILDHSP